MISSRRAGESPAMISDRRPAIRHGLGLIGLGFLWFAGATFGIVAPLAEEYFGSAGPIYLTNRFSTNPLDWLLLLRDPARLRPRFVREPPAGEEHVIVQVLKQLELSPEGRRL